MRSLVLGGFALTALLVATAIGNTDANAVVYCKTVGVPKGCIARPVARPVARPAVVYCKRVGVPKGCVMR